MIRRLLTSGVLRFLLVSAVAIYVAVVGLMYLFQRNFLYVNLLAIGYVEPAAHGLPQARRMAITADDGAELLGWWIAPQQADAPVFLYFHGNAHGLENRAGRFGLMSADGSGVLAMSYRSYGGSQGRPKEILIHADARVIYRHLTEKLGIAPQRVVLFGESLGTGVALNLGRQVEAKAIILDSPYLSVLRRGQATYPWLPVSLLLKDTFRSDLWIGEAKAPVLILHGKEDRLIPIADSEELAARGRPGNVTRILYDGQPHVVRYNRGPERDVPAFLKGLR